jgi:hypothetical protein
MGSNGKARVECIERCYHPPAPAEAGRGAGAAAADAQGTTDRLGMAIRI